MSPNVQMSFYVKDSLSGLPDLCGLIDICVGCF